MQLLQRLQAKLHELQPHVLKASGKHCSHI
jgi:hypothetical protein